MAIHRAMAQIHLTLEGLANQPERHKAAPLLSFTPPSATTWTVTVIPKTQDWHDLGRLQVPSWSWMGMAGERG